MHINWFTLIAQVINFLILVWLLKRFLYKPILDAIDEREKKVTSQLRIAQEKEAEANKVKVEFFGKSELFDQERKKLMDQAIFESNEKREKLLEETRNEATDLRSKLENEFHAMHDNLQKELAQKTQQEVFAIARMTLSTLASQSLEEQTVALFIKRMKDLKSADQKKIIEAFKKSANPIAIQSAFELPEKHKTEITSAIHVLLGEDSSVQFTTKHELLSGIELTANGYKLGWNISEFINSFEKTISATKTE